MTYNQLFLSDFTNLNRYLELSVSSFIFATNNNKIIAKKTVAKVDTATINQRIGYAFFSAGLASSTTKFM